MHKSAKWVAPALFLIAVTLAATFTNYSTINYPNAEETVLENGLVARIRFGRATYRAFDRVDATYEYYNPTQRPITFVPAALIHVEAGYEGGYPHHYGEGKIPAGPVTLQQGENYSGFTLINYALVPGRFTLNANDTKASVNIANGKLVARIQTSKETYRVGQGGTASLEVYNPSSSPVSYPSNIFGQLEFRYGYLNGTKVIWEPMTMVIFRDFMFGITIVSPGDSLTIEKFYFPTPKEGTIVLDSNGVTKNVNVSNIVP
jgi:hypothetical protein